MECDIHMALILKRITNPYECVRCSVTNKLISYGEEYYWDPIDNFIVDFEYYYDRKLAMKREEAMWKVHQATNLLSYKQQMLNAERDFLEQTMYDREIYDPVKHGNLLEYLAKEQFGEPPTFTKGGRK
jgi:hypothetical protein